MLPLLLTLIFTARFSFKGDDPPVIITRTLDKKIKTGVDMSHFDVTNGPGENAFFFGIQPDGYRRN